MTSQVDICNMALGQIVQNTAITGIDPPSPPGVASRSCAQLYQTQVDATFRAAHWNCARFQAAGTLLAARRGTPQNPSGALPEPPQPWLYMYAYPADCLLVRFVFPLCNTPSVAAPVMTNVGINYLPIIRTSLPFVPASALDADSNRIKVILTNCPQAQLVYTGRLADPDLWDPALINAAVGVMAAWLVNPVARNAGLLKERVAVATSLIEAGRISDGNEGITSTDIIPDWMAVRNTGSGWGDAFGNGWGVPGGGFMGGWDAIAMPNGLSF
jgi:hypothetical protein